MIKSKKEAYYFVFYVGLQYLCTRISRNTNKISYESMETMFA